MCGRSRCTLNPQRVAAATGVPPERWRDNERYYPKENMSPGSFSPVVRRDKAGQLEIHCMKWGLVPSWTKPAEKPDHYRMFNARSETVPQKGVFSRLLNRNRCIVLLDGFYEWKKDGKEKQPYYVKLDGADRPIQMAGLFDVWESEQGQLYTYTIMTTDSSKRLSWLHDRMPVILPDEVSQQAWLASQDDFNIKTLSTVSVPYNGEDLQWLPVTKAMGNAQYQEADCAKEFKKPSAASFFKPKKAKAAEPAEDTKKPSPDTDLPVNTDENITKVEQEEAASADGETEPAKGASNSTKVKVEDDLQTAAQRTAPDSEEQKPQPSPSGKKRSAPDAEPHSPSGSKDVSAAGKGTKAKKSKASPALEKGQKTMQSFFTKRT